MKKIILVTVIALGLSACAQTKTAAPEDTKLKQAYSACMNTAEGNPDKIQACQSVLDVLAKEKSQEEFAKKQTIRSQDYQNCIQAGHSGNNQAIRAQCDKIWQEIRANNKQ
jgi:hypothetical protein